MFSQEYWTAKYKPETRWQRFTRRLLRRPRPIEDAHHVVLTWDGTSANIYKDGYLTYSSTSGVPDSEHMRSAEEILAFYQQGLSENQP